MNHAFDFIKNMFTNYLINKTYKTELRNIGNINRLQIENLFSNNGIELQLIPFDKKIKIYLNLILC